MAAAPTSQDAVGEAMGLIDGAGLPHPMVQVVASFVLDAVNPQLAADYIISKCSEAGDQPHEAVKVLVSDWKCVLYSVAMIPEVLSDMDVECITCQMYIRQMRTITRGDVCPTGAPFSVGNMLRGSIQDGRVWGGRPRGSFADEDGFSSILQYGDDPGRKNHDVVFTHADVNPRNILIDLYNLPGRTRDSRVSGIVDWEFAGFYPEYWEYTKSLFEGFRWSERYAACIMAYSSVSKSTIWSWR